MCLLPLFFVPSLIFHSLPFVILIEHFIGFHFLSFLVYLFIFLFGVDLFLLFRWLSSCLQYTTMIQFRCQIT
jgi:hypothetical protein